MSYTFILQPEITSQSRTLKVSNHNSGTYKKINQAVKQLKLFNFPHKLVCIDEEGKMRTILIFQGINPQPYHVFTQKKLSNMINVGWHMYMPKSLSSKTTKRRNRINKNLQSHEKGI